MASLRLVLFYLTIAIYLSDVLCEFSKCCNNNKQVLTKNLTCTNQKSNIYLNEFVYGNNENRSFFNNCKENEYCIDRTDYSNYAVKVKCDRNEWINLTYDQILHKCCPINHVYNTYKKACVLSNKTAITMPYKYQYVEYGLAECMKKPIIDYTGKNLNELEKVHRFSNLDFKKYCIDEVEGDDDNDKFVIRMCYENTDICKMNSYTDDAARCIVKCCPDGHMYQGFRCRPTFNNGINMANKRILNGTNRKLILIFAVTFVLFCLIVF